MAGLRFGAIGKIVNCLDEISANCLRKKAANTGEYANQFPTGGKLQPGMPPPGIPLGIGIRPPDIPPRGN